MCLILQTLYFSDLAEHVIKVECPILCLLYRWGLWYFLLDLLLRRLYRNDLKVLDLVCTEAD